MALNPDTIRQTRTALGLTQTGLSTRAGISTATLQSIEAGTANPSLSTLAKVLGALGMDLTIRPERADWDALAALGLPLTTSTGGGGASSAGSLRQFILQAALELTHAAPAQGHTRKRESLQALLLALCLHFPSVYAGWFGRVPLIALLLPTDPSGRLVKLSRVARAGLVRTL